jgi:hypothetical protein
MSADHSANASDVLLEARGRTKAEQSETHIGSRILLAKVGGSGFPGKAVEVECAEETTIDGCRFMIGQEAEG